METVFHTDKRIRLGVWGLGRGARLAQAANMLHIDLVAGCDVNAHMRETFKRDLPNAFVTDDEDAFLASDIDAVLIATYFHDHAKHTLKALHAGKHVLCEVTAFTTPGDGVKVVEAVEKSGKIYNLMENYPFSKENMVIKKLWSEGFFGELQYGEVDYLHEARTLSYAYNVDGGIPVTPGDTVHSWRSKLDINYYNTHSFGAAMNLTGLRPVSVRAIPCDVHLPGYLECPTHGTIAVQMVQMENGALIRNAMGATTHDSHFSNRLMGTKASVYSKRNELKVRIGGVGAGLDLDLKANWPEYGELADKSDHGGADFWELYFFAKEYFTGEKSPWNVYAAADATLVGIMSSRSSAANGELQKIPDFRKKSDRDTYRNDFEYFDAFDTQHIFPEGHDKELTGKFSAMMVELYPLYLDRGIPVWNMAQEGMRIYPQIADSDTRGKLEVIKNVERCIHCLPALGDNCRLAQKIADAYPDSLPGKMLHKLLASLDLNKIYDVEGTTKKLYEFLETRYQA